MTIPDPTPREREVLLLASEVRSDNEIAERLGVVRGTVVTYWTRLRERTGAVNRTQAVALEMARLYRSSEAELARTAGLYRSMVDGLDEFAVFLMDGERRVTSWNPGVGKILGYGEQEWVGLSGDVMVPVRDIEGAIVCFSKILRDLTRLKRFERRIEELGGDPKGV